VKASLDAFFLPHYLCPTIFAPLFLVCSMWRCSEANAGGVSTDLADVNQ
jgi:hypothetical protein